MTIKLKGPKNHTGLSHGGISYEPRKDGSIEVPEDVVAHALAHGFEIHAEPDAKEETPARLEKPAAATTLKK